MSITPIFYDHSSFKSLLTFWDDKDVKPTGPQSIIPLCKEGGLKKCVFVSKNFSTFIEAWKACKKEGIQLVFGVEFIMVEDAKARTPESQRGEHKIIVFMKNSKGYEDLLKIYSACHGNPDHKYYYQRFDYKQLAALWTENLHLVIPFFDGFIARNKIGYAANIMPDLGFCSPTIFREVRANHIAERPINSAIDAFNASANWPEEKTKTIYYKTRKDYKAYNVYRALMNSDKQNAMFDNPELEMFCSAEFCWEAYKELVAK
jgi:DNA polymerase III alpha subunit